MITLLGSGGIRRVGVWLELTGLDRLVAASYGAQQRLSELIEAATVNFGPQETARLAQGMRPQKISIGQDETLHPEPC